MTEKDKGREDGLDVNNPPSFTTKSPWLDIPNVWKNEAAFRTWLRGSVRRIWSRHPIKIEYKNSRRYKAPVGRYGKDVWVSDCEICGKQSRDTEVDHIHGGKGWNSWDEFCVWMYGLLYVTFADIRELCKECHAIVTHSQKLGCSFEEAKVDKEAISIQNTGKDKEWLKGHGIVPDKRKEQRKEQIKNVMRGQ